MEGTNRLITKISRTAQMYVAQTMRQRGLSASATACLHAVRKHPGLSQEQLSRELGVDKAAVARLIHRLEQQALIRREKSPGDRRVNLLFATEQAQSYKLETVTAEEQFYNWLMEELAPQERQALDAALEKLYLKSKQERRNHFIHVKEGEGGNEDSGD